ncbi:PP2C family protein-serine/threonine phosphatase [Cellulomonas chengniuliangii]|uniref:SpoIIE family protein phosphatase n=1 Tax=Cellulomonas chengniuliangii TaxID=2968084 RepID=A0ABY5L2E0_9CELL|nr:SpoIIE family protein phosphatase [Cellulomonas chengniuliangii]MCC2309147.1 SpoIIE family protein phosphatase [Cellulomonas chengniuliangii]MCC2319170.1 SpoIIE family protein phosphatase [Cellulomonas chengniuliangii]MCC2319403.1 SpoIIE family protein phosphatase [Cellulomonas chengniuliangii]UUI76977.1 SpoIIE family protein phosphatase [Cellulomonas chengniuliangii]
MASAPQVAVGTPVAGQDEFRVLLVEDDDGDALLVEEGLRDADLHVGLLRARTLDEALERLDVDCVLLDLGLPDAFGFDALQRLLAAGAPAVVVLTGLAGGDVGLAAVAHGAQDYLVKGEADSETLGRSVRYAVQRRRLEESDRALYRSLVRAEENNRLERALLPTPMVHDPRLEVRVGYRAGRDGLLGGDFYDVVERHDGTVLALVGDVCGHGPDEAALGATLRTAWRTLVLADVAAEDILPLLERVLEAERSRPEVFTTVSMIEVAADRASADLYLAGHPVPLMLGERSRLAPATARGRALGIPVTGGWSPLRLELGDAWKIMMYTDGVLEATVRDSADRIGKEGLRRLVDAAVAHAAHDLVTEVLHGVHELHGGELVDDAALVVVGWGA